MEKEKETLIDCNMWNAKILIGDLDFFRLHSKKIEKLDEDFSIEFEFNRCETIDVESFKKEESIREKNITISFRNKIIVSMEFLPDSLEERTIGTNSLIKLKRIENGLDVRFICNKFDLKQVLKSLNLL